MLGTVGARDRMDTTVISDAVNLASRVENLTKTYGVRLIVTEDTRLALRDPGAVSLRRIDRVLVEGNRSRSSCTGSWMPRARSSGAAS